VSPRGFRRGKVNFRSHNSCFSLGAPFPGRRRACVRFGFFFPGRVVADRTTRRHGLVRPPPNWVGWAERVVIFGEAAVQEGNSTFLGVVKVRQPASAGTKLVLLPFVPCAAGGALQRQVWLSQAGSMADGGRNGDPPCVEVPGAGADEITPLGDGSSVDDRHTSAGTTDAGARGQRT